MKAKRITTILDKRQAKNLAEVLWVFKFDLISLI